MSEKKSTKSKISKIIIIFISVVVAVMAIAVAALIAFERAMDRKLDAIINSEKGMSKKSPDDYAKNDLKRIESQRKPNYANRPKITDAGIPILYPRIEKYSENKFKWVY